MADLLNIETLIEQPTISINGQRYRILHPDQLGILDFQRLATMAGRVSEFMAKPDIDDFDAAELSQIIADLTDRIMVDISEDVRALLTESQRLAVAEVFMMLPMAQTRRPKAKPKAAKRKRKGSAGSKPRSDANGSTAATPPAG